MSTPARGTGGTGPNGRRSALFYLGHPAHFHMLKHTIRAVQDAGAQAQVVIRPKEILEELVSTAGMDYVRLVARRRTRGGSAAMIGEMLRREARMLALALRRRPDVLVGTSAEIAHVGTLLRRPSVVFSEDDHHVVPLLARVAYPFATTIMAPFVCNVGERWERKKCGYAGYQKLGYLHPNRFTPDRSKVEALLAGRGRYSLVRLVQLTAHHDEGIRGLDAETTARLIRRLAEHGDVYLSSEGALPPELERYRLRLDPHDIHHALAFADLFVGDSQSMAVEAAVLGTPSVRFSDFAGRISVLEELEHAYGLTVGVPAGEPGRLLKVVDELLARPGLREEWARRRARMLADKIDPTAFWTWFLLEYPRSRAVVAADPSHQARFR